MEESASLRAIRHALKLRAGHLDQISASLKGGFDPDRLAGFHLAELEATRQAILAVLTDRFEAIPPHILERIRRADDMRRLEYALLRSLSVPNPNALPL